MPEGFIDDGKHPSGFKDHVPSTASQEARDAPKPDFNENARTHAELLIHDAEARQLSGAKATDVRPMPALINLPSIQEVRAQQDMDDAPVFDPEPIVMEQEPEMTEQELAQQIEQDQEQEPEEDVQMDVGNIPLPPHAPTSPPASKEVTVALDSQRQTRSQTGAGYSQHLQLSPGAKATLVQQYAAPNPSNAPIPRAATGATNSDMEAESPLDGPSRRRSNTRWSPLAGQSPVSHQFPREGLREILQGEMTEEERQAQMLDFHAGVDALRRSSAMASQAADRVRDGRQQPTPPPNWANSVILVPPRMGPHYERPRTQQEVQAALHRMPYTPAQRERAPLLLVPTAAPRHVNTFSPTPNHMVQVECAERQITDMALAMQILQNLLSQHAYDSQGTFDMLHNIQEMRMRTTRDLIASNQRELQLKQQLAQQVSLTQDGLLELRLERESYYKELGKLGQRITESISGKGDKEAEINKLKQGNEDYRRHNAQKKEHIQELKAQLEKSQKANEALNKELATHIKNAKEIAETGLDQVRTIKRLEDQLSQQQNGAIQDLEEQLQDSHVQINDLEERAKEVDSEQETLFNQSINNLENAEQERDKSYAARDAAMLEVQSLKTRVDEAQRELAKLQAQQGVKPAASSSAELLARFRNAKRKRKAEGELDQEGTGSSFVDQDAVDKAKDKKNGPQDPPKPPPCGGIPV
jgi:hypothetical protein